MSEVIGLFREKDTRDELGLGSIRDAIANRLFPGTSTIQTHARYFLFIPWIYQRNLRKADTAAAYRRLIEEDHAKLVLALTAGGESKGVIGVEKVEDLKRLPSSIYWAGLGRLGIRTWSRDEDQFRRQAIFKKGALEEDSDDSEGHPADDGGWSLRLKPPDGLLKKITFKMGREEAQFLQGKIQDVGETLFGSLVSNPANLRNEVLAASFAWEMPGLDSLPEKLQEELKHARNFSVLMHGAALLYNHMLADQSGRDQAGKDYENLMADWGQAVRLIADELRTWDLKVFWDTWEAGAPVCGLKTREFVTEWLDTVLIGARPERIFRNPRAQSLIAGRELKVKPKGRARLGNPRALELWSGSSGAGQLDYRWFRAREMAKEILEGLKRAPNA